MFGFGKSYDEEYLDFYEYLTKQWKMKPEYAKSFLTPYKKNIGKIYTRGKKRQMSALENSSNSKLTLMAFGSIGREREYAIVGQAYQAYMSDLRRGKYVGTMVEKSIWAILYKNIILLKSFDRGFSQWIFEQQEEMFPGLMTDVFQNYDEDGFSNLSMGASSENREKDNQHQVKTEETRLYAPRSTVRRQFHLSEETLSSLEEESLLLPKSPGVFVINNKLNGRQYFICSNNMRVRAREESYKLKKKRHANKILQSDYQLFGSENFEIIIVDKKKDNLDLIKVTYEYVNKELKIGNKLYNKYKSEI